jgi:hypothetical protein
MVSMSACLRSLPQVSPHPSHSPRPPPPFHLPQGEEDECQKLLDNLWGAVALAQTPDGGQEQGQQLKAMDIEDWVKRVGGLVSIVRNSWRSKRDTHDRRQWQAEAAAASAAAAAQAAERTAAAAASACNLVAANTAAQQAEFMATIAAQNAATAPRSGHAQASAEDAATAARQARRWAGEAANRIYWWPATALLAAPGGGGFR